ncbi:16S rRNA (uracil(1498)-N(3))-methyltransferase [Methylocystis sp. H62]|uniref:16S rRNA (uracil(1498)-N(3))-methyltransferase n=1 Tax=Methylocystis sp. H62 TaxID=2785789 RepID=UPI0018C2E718|nr:16S rRNA (uracil(1498)-N(3))-methyltransferase [Methylocystis sp. H62]MBG0795409.1 16S rRNA (uracil(1498)-N(3))-methyltransferase [Methylocystis sp. H62]
MASAPCARVSAWEVIVSAYDFSAQRLFVRDDLAPDVELAPSAEAANYLLNVLRMREGAAIHVFNGRDGEFRATLANVSRRSARLRVGERLRPQTIRADLDYCFAPLKQARLDYMAQKATEMGAGRLLPVITRRTQVRRLNSGRLESNVIEAAEQCGVLAVPEVAAAVELQDFTARWPARRLLVFCDEHAALANPLDALHGRTAREGVSVLIGPEGGFDDAERAAIAGLPNVARLSLGPRVLRADTAAVAALAIVQAAIGDWVADGRRLNEK